MGAAIKAFFDFLTELFGWVNEELKEVEKQAGELAEETQEMAERAKARRIELAEQMRLLDAELLEAEKLNNQMGEKK